MPALSLDAFWDAVAASRLVADGRLPQLRVACEADAGAAAAEADKQTALAAQWLVRQGVLTLWQAKRLTRSGGGSFFIGGYRLLDKREHLHGGDIYRGLHEPTQRKVALVPLDRKACERVEVWTEVVNRTERAAQTTDPALSRTWALEEADSGRFIVAEDLPGPSLAEDLTQRGGWPAATAVAAILPLCRGVAEIHRLGGVHGLITSANVVRAAAADTSPVPWKLLQHPLAGDPLGQLSADRLRQSRAIGRLGEAVCFMPPERLTTGDPITPAGDVYSLGCLLHALLVGRLAVWQGDAPATAAFLRQAFAAGTPLPVIPQCPAEVAQLLAYLTAVDPDRRYADAAEAADAIAACLGQPSLSEALPPQQPRAENLLVAARKPAGQPTAAETAAKPFPWRWPAAIGAGVIAVGLLAAGGAALFSGGKQVPSGPPQATAGGRGAAAAAGGTSATPATDEAAPVETVGRFVVEQDDTLPWLPPTAGEPPAFRYLPAGSQLILLARPAELLAGNDGRLLLKTGDVAAVVAKLEALLGQPLAAVEQLQIGWQADAEGRPLAGIWARFLEPVGAPDKPVGAPGEPEVEQLGSWLRWRPAAAADREILIASPSLAEPLRRAGAAGGLPRSLRPLLTVLDDQRQLTLLGGPHYLVHDARSMLPAALLPLLDPIERLLGAECPAAAVSLHLDDRTYIEIDAVSPAVGSAKGLKQRLARGLTTMADVTEEVISTRQLVSWGKRLVLRLPQLLRLVERQLRVAIERRDLVVANAYLPEFAGHNIAVAATVLLEQLAAAPAGGRPTAVAQSVRPLTLTERLQQPVDIAFARDTLETAVQLLGEESGIPIDIAGGDLELEGITKNQSFGLEQRDVPAGAVLLTILAKSDGGTGKLVYVVRQQAGEERIVITTRAAAAKRKEALPEVFSSPDTAVPPPQ